MSETRIFLFDIDCTLVETSGVGLRSLLNGLEIVFPDAYAASIEPSLNLGGSTDAAITAELFTHYGIPDSTANRDAFFDAYLSALRRNLEAHRNHPNSRSLPGARAILEKLHPNPNSHLGLLTGNLREGARAKLEEFDLWEYFGFGAYGHEHPCRDQLATLARERAITAVGHDVPPKSIYVIGDTPRDIRCGQAIGATTVGVATGASSAADLAACGADVVLDSLEAFDPG